jgi:hypothetical protein
MIKVLATSLAIVLLSLAVINDTPYSSVIAGGGNDKHKEKHDKGNICGGLVAEFEKLNDVVNDETLTGEQFDAVEDLRLFLVFKLHCVDEFEGFEWS